MKRPEKYSDDELIRLLSAGTKNVTAAFNEIYRRYSSKVFAYLVFISGNRHQAEDIFQETWIRFDSAAKSGINIHSIPAFIITIARNLTNNYHTQKNSKLNFATLDEVIDSKSFSENSFDESLENEEFTKILSIAVDSLDDIYKESFVLRKIDELPYSRIAEMLGETEDCIRKRVCRATIKIKDYFKPYLAEITNLSKR
ncbi:MAG: hypothetical protein QG635_2429 [Bacteroidota bacterium]|nr:hypothetical protein [Bacteroidota bacterium]